MRAEFTPTSFDIRVYETGSYAERSPYVFAVRGNVAADHKLYLTAAAGKFSLAARRAIDAEVKRMGYAGADWERVKIRDGKKIEVPLKKRVR